MQIKQAHPTDYPNHSLSLANQTVDLLDRLDARRSEKPHPIPVEERHTRRVRRIDGTVKLETAALSSSPCIEVEIVHLSPEVKAARIVADKMVQPWQADNELKVALNAKRALEFARHATPEARIKALESADSRIKKAQADCDAVGVSKYAQTVRALRDYAVAIEKQSRTELNGKAFVKHCVIDLETMVRCVKNLEKGVNGDLPALNINAPFDPLTRLTAVKDHLDDKITRINSNQDRRLDRLVEVNPILCQLQKNLSQLPHDAAIFFFNRDGQIIKAPMSKPGNILVGVDRQEYPKSKLRPDGTFLNRDGQPVKVEMTYKVIDVPRWKNCGNGPNGAGLDRFNGDDIAGAAIVRPKEGAKPIQATKRVFVEKEVVCTTGDVPQAVVAGMSFKDMAKKFGNMEYRPK